MRWKWRPERAEAYAEVLTEQIELQEQLESAIGRGDIECACFCIRSMVDQAASDRRVGMTEFVSVCAHLRGKGGAHSPPWFDAECKEKRTALREAVRSGQATHACEFLRRRYKVHVRWAKRVYTRRKRDLFLHRFYSKDPQVHASLRKVRRAHCTPISQGAWADYLKKHFRPHVPSRVGPGPDVGREQAVPIGRGHDVVDLLRQRREGVRVQPDVVEPPDLTTIQGLVARQIGKMNAQASPGFDCVAAPFIKYAVVQRLRPSGRGYDRVNVLEPYIAQLFKLLFEKARIPDDWKKG